MGGGKNPPIIIKNTLGLAEHGQDYKKIREAVLQHQIALRKKTIEAPDYKIILPKIYGSIMNGEYLLMEKMHLEQGERFANTTNPEVEKSFYAARSRMHKNLSKIQPNLDLDHIMRLGNTNPKEPLKGKWVFCLPYDYNG